MRPLDLKRKEIETKFVNFKENKKKKKKNIIRQINFLKEKNFVHQIKKKHKINQINEILIN